MAVDALLSQKAHVSEQSHPPLEGDDTIVVLYSKVDDGEGQYKELASEAMDLSTAATWDVRRQLLQTYGSYILGKIQGMEVTHILYHRACDTIISSRVFWQIPEQVHPKLIDVGKQDIRADG